ncbi:hypothetical protein HDU98_007031 [Podochytrium sp. JEL0797]|nr:hypothetical protein HDU98_007031 [Podochytrium sp. JEL0797]
MRQLLTAIAERDAACVQRILGAASHSQRSELLSATDASGIPLLLKAARSRNKSIIAAVLDNSPREWPVNTLDPESGGTVLHWALYEGLLEIALLLLNSRSDLDLLLRDNEGCTCFDLLDLTFDSTLTKLGRISAHSEEDGDSDDDESHSVNDGAPHAPHEVKYATSVWTWGKNSNLQLGHANSNDRIHPERVELAPHLHLESPVSFDSLLEHKPSISMMSLSKFHSVIVTDRHVIVHDLSSSNIVFVSAGPDHTVAVTENGRVFTWGSNKWGQLGYETHVGNKDPAAVLVPTEVTNTLKKVKIVGAAASKYHTVVFSNTGLVFTWGWNIGQLGYEQQPNTNSPLQQTPRKITAMLQADILCVSATNNATAILFSRGEVHVFANFETKRIQFSIPPPPLMQSAKTHLTSHIVKIVSGNHQFAALSIDGDVFLWSPPVHVEEFKSTWQQMNFPQTKPRRIWNARNHGLKARDVAVGIDSTILIATESGHAYCGVRRKDVKVKESNGFKDVVFFKFTRVPYLHNVHLVYASLSGAFAAVRRDSLPPNVVPGPVTLRSDLRNIMVLDSTAAKTLPGGPFVDTHLSVSFEGEEYLLGAHRVLLSARSPFFRQLFEQLLDGNVDGLETDAFHAFNSAELASGCCIRFKKEVAPKSLFSALELIYSGGYSRADWEGSTSDLYPNNANSRRKEPKHRPVNTYFRIQTDFYYLARLFGVEETAGISGSAGLERFQLSLEECNPHGGDAFMRGIADVVLELQDGRLFCHRLFLAARSPFFDAMFGLGSRWSLKREQEGSVVVVELRHFSKEVMLIVLDWIYTDMKLGHLVKGLVRRDLMAYVNALIDVLSVANELLLERLKEQVCEALSRLIGLENVVELLEVADVYEAAQLKTCCLTFLCWNLSSAIESRLLDFVPAYLISDIEASLHEMQVAKSPEMRGDNGFYAEIRVKVAVEELEYRLYQSSAVAKEERAKERAIVVESRAHLNEERLKAWEKRKREAKAESDAAKKLAARNRMPTSFDDDSLQFEMESLELGSNTAGQTPKSKKKASWTKFDAAVKPPKCELPAPAVPASPVLASTPTRPWDTKAPPKLSLNEIMKQTESSKRVVGQIPVKRLSSGIPPPSPVLSKLGTLVKPHTVSTSSTNPVAPRQSAASAITPTPLVFPEPPINHIPIKIVPAKKSQRERKRESIDTATVGIPASSSPSVVTDEPAWKIPQPQSARIDSAEIWPEKQVHADDFWGGSGGGGAGSVSPIASPSSKWGSGTKTNAGVAGARATSFVTGVGSSASFPAFNSGKPSLSEIQEEEMNRRKKEVDLRETIKGTSFADIQREEELRRREEAERLELLEQFGVNMVFRNNAWEVEAVGGGGSSAQASAGKKKRGKPPQGQTLHPKNDGGASGKKKSRPANPNPRTPTKNK